jgi:hypothetical protein
MGVSVQQLRQIMTAQEFGQHYALEIQEPMPSAQWTGLGALLAALANGPLQAPQRGRMWAAHDFTPALWQDLTDIAEAPPKPQALTVEQIMASAKRAGMVQ